jgi:peroxiredoxin
MIEVGTKAPDFVLPGEAGQSEKWECKLYTLEDELSRGPVVLNFYSFNFVPESTRHLSDLHDIAWFELEDAVTPLGISTDACFSHEAFAEEEDLWLPLLSDSDGAVAESYDVLYEECKGHKRIARRSVFVIDEDGIIRYAWAGDQIEDQPDWSEVKSAVEGLS